MVGLAAASIVPLHVPIKHQQQLIKLTNLLFVLQVLVYKSVATCLESATPNNEVMRTLKHKHAHEP